MAKAEPGTVMNDAVAIVVLNWNNATDTIACVESLRQLDYANFRVVIVDNNSRAEEIAALEAGCPGNTTLKQPRNRGFAGGCNAGIRWALSNGFSFIWLLNNDTVVDRGSLAQLMLTMKQDARVGVAGGFLYHWREPQRIQSAGGYVDPETGHGRMLAQDEIDCGQFSESYDVDYVSGAVMLIRADAIKEVGLLDERFFMYYEDTDFGLRMRAHGWRCVSNPAAKVWHKDQASSGDKQTYFGQHGYFMFLYNNRPRLLPHAVRLHARRYLRPHFEARQWKLLWLDAKVYWTFLKRLALVRPNVQP